MSETSEHSTLPPEEQCKKQVGDSTPLMRQLARMASIPWGRIRRMVLVLDVDAMPVLHCECYLTSDEQLVETPVIVSEEPPEPFDTTNIQNKEWRTFSPRPEK